MLYLITNKINVCYLPLKDFMMMKLGPIIMLLFSIVLLLFSLQVVQLYPSLFQYWSLKGNQNDIFQITENQRLFSLSIVPPNSQLNVFMLNDFLREPVHFTDNDLKESKTETKTSVKLAKEMISQKRPERAHKIFLHALALDAHDPDLLTAYGEFLETYSKDVVAAEHHYCKALKHSPAHMKALANRRRTQPLVEQIDQSYFTRLELKRDTLMRVPDGHPGMRRMITENYFRHIYHTTAMEGNTFTLSQTRSFVESRIVIAGKSILEHQEILGMEAALHLINSSLPKRMGSLRVKDILDIHQRVLGFVDPLGSGMFRKTQVFVGSHIPPPSDEIEALMEAFITWLNSEAFLDMHPIEMAALAHYKLVFIHPFYDGNGRTSRLLMNLLLMMSGYPPIIIPVEKKQMYYEHLETANAGDVRPFIRFIAACAEQTLDEYLWASVDKLDSMHTTLHRKEPISDITKIFSPKSPPDADSYHRDQTDTDSKHLFYRHQDIDLPADEKGGESVKKGDYSGHGDVRIVLDEQTTEP